MGMTDDHLNYELQQQELEAERYERLLDAFAELLEKGVSSNTISTLVFETGLKADDLEKHNEVE